MCAHLTLCARCFWRTLFASAEWLTKPELAKHRRTRFYIGATWLTGRLGIITEHQAGIANPIKSVLFVRRSDRGLRSNEWHWPRSGRSRTRSAGASAKSVETRRKRIRVRHNQGVGGTSHRDPNLNRSANRQAAKVRFKGPRKIADSRYHTYGFAILFACILIYMGLILTMGLSWKSYRDGYIAKSARGHYLVFPKGDNIRNRSSGL